ncbi:uncharacterized protein TM35_000291320 [Trypanosoma theileri]|uniref:Uncharacterized protein n=1 Tax=Trypanosoma theileri TaxID=67003 RepID=A0A1X0NQ37_9TRYP|nr:uncharacterized protein TM35_000291320 [Trypanosoma theileri]ORC86250.1 hypothetical protein TM35_000291320 [Trypanosoma theileri]
MDLWQEVSPGSGVWYISREIYLSVCICVANRTSNSVVVELRWNGHPTLSNAVILAPISNKYTTNKKNDNDKSMKHSSSDTEITVTRVIHPDNTVVLLTVSPADDSMPMTLDFQLNLLDAVPPPSEDKRNVILFDNAVAQSRVVEEWLQQQQQQRCSSHYKS